MNRYYTHKIVDCADLVKNNSHLNKKILESTYNQYSLIGKQIVLNIDNLTNKQYLILYINKHSCSTCIDEAIYDVSININKHKYNFIIVADEFDKQDISILKQKFDNILIVDKFSFNSNKEDILSPTIFLTDSLFNITNAYVYVQELPRHNSMFIKSINN